MTTHLYAIILRLAQNRLIESFLPLYRCFGLHSSCEVLKRSIALWKQRLSSSCRIHKEHRYFRITRSKTRSPPCRPQRSQDLPKNDRFLFIAIGDRFYFRNVIDPFPCSAQLHFFISQQASCRRRTQCKGRNFSCDFSGLFNLLSYPILFLKLISAIIAVGVYTKKKE